MRLFNESEIGAILKRTAELSKSVDGQNADGLSLEEIKELASEAGLDPALVIRAATELSTGGSDVEKSDFFGGPLSHSLDIELDVKVDLATWENMLPVIRSHFKDPGIVQTRTGALEWTGGGGDRRRNAHVSIHKTNSGSRLHVFWSETSSAIPFFIPTLISLVLSPAILFEELALGPEGVFFWVGIVATFFFLSRLGVMSMKKRHVQSIDMLGKELTQIALQSDISKRTASEAHETEGEKQAPSRAQEQEPELKSVRVEETPEIGPSIEIPDDEFEDRNESSGKTSERELS